MAYRVGYTCFVARAVQAVYVDRVIAVQHGLYHDGVSP